MSNSKIQYDSKELDVEVEYIRENPGPPILINNLAIYDTKSYPIRGLAIIFNQRKFKNSKKFVERIGTDVDATVMSEVLTDLKFKVIIHNDLKKEDISSHMAEVGRTDHSSYDCIVVVVLTHGDDDDKLCAFDKSYRREELYKPIANCLTLVGKPKIFIIQACRGQMVDKGHLVNIECDACAFQATPSAIPTMADFLIMCPTFAGYLSYRDTGEGTEFIKCLGEELRKEVTAEEKTDILTISTHVNFNMTFNRQHNNDNPKLQAGNTLTSMTKKFYFYNLQETPVAST